MIITARAIELVISGSVMPIARASILVATDRTSRTKIFDGSGFSSTDLILNER